MSTKITNRTPIQIQARIIWIGCIVFILMGLLNILFRFTPMVPTLFPKLIISGDLDRIRFVFQTIGYVLYSVTFASLIPMAIGIRNITDIYFVDHITKSGKQTATWIFIYSASVLLDMISLGWPMISGFVALALIVGRVLAFTKLNKTFEKIKRIFDIKVGSFFYLLFAYYAIITMVLGAVANYVRDVEFEVFLAIFNGAIESVLMIIVGAVLIYDVFQIKKFIEDSDIQPYSSKKAYLSVDRTDKPVLSTTKAHVQSTTQIEKLQESSAKQEMRIQKLRAKEKAKKEAQGKTIEKKTMQISYITCHQCNERTDKNLSYCMNCGESLKDAIASMKKEISDISVRRILSPKKEKILQQVAAAAFLTAFVVYAFVAGEAVLKTYAWIIIALFATYLFVNYIVLFFSGRGFAVTTVLSDISFLFIILPVLCAIFSYFVTLAVVAMTEDTLMEDFRWMLIGLTIALSLTSILSMLSFKVRQTNMNLKEYIAYRLDFKARTAELNKEQERVEKKRANFDSLDRIEANMAKQRQEKVMNYEDFDYKQRLKDLGSPLTNDDED